MRVTLACLLLLAGVAAATPSDAAGQKADAGAVAGRGITESGNLEVDIQPCGQALCGIVTRVLANRSMANPGMAMGERPAVGLRILDDFKPSGERTWEGRIFNRENGKTYDCVMTAVTTDEITIRGYVFLPLFGQTQTWRRAAAN